MHATLWPLRKYKANTLAWVKNSVVTMVASVLQVLSFLIRECIPTFGIISVSFVTIYNIHCILNDQSNTRGIFYDFLKHFCFISLVLALIACMVVTASRLHPR
jgi:hypothetical protein